jgi:hypothetical protein
MLGLLFPIPMTALVVWFVLGRIHGLGEFPASWTALVPLALAVGAYSFCELVGFRATPVQPGGTPAQVENQSWLAFNKSTLMRFLVCEAVFFASISIAFVATNYWPVLIGAALALALIGWEAWPTQRNLQRFAAALESGGHPSYLLGRPMDRI